MKILRPAYGEKVYEIAAETFDQLYFESTGQRLLIVTEPEPDEDLIVIGSDSVNDFTRDALINGWIPSPFVRCGSDGYRIFSALEGERRLLFLAGGRGRSTLYAVYRFFELQAGRRYFWDGDVVPPCGDIELENLSISESPRFEYRGLRYFAHRGLIRFQAEHWGLKDWQREIDWMLKKRLNFFMLRIGLDDLYQQAFPDIVDYPDNQGFLPEAGEGFDDRSLFWSLQYRGELRKKLLQYAFDRDLMHPEDCGTMTHWYSRTPQQFLDRVNPSFMPQTTQVYRQPTGLVWDIRQKENLDNYFRLTQTHLERYGRPSLFHTIGLAERLCSDDREENIRLKLYTYGKISEFLEREYPRCPLLVASWDFAMYWHPNEVKRLLSSLNPQQAIILDYISDTEDIRKNFLHWGVIGKYPWIFGILHAFEPNSDIRGNYDALQARLPIAAEDSFCKGMIFWPELSHSDTLMLYYFTKNAWQPNFPAVESLIPSFCADRYQSFSGFMEPIWQEFLPIVKLSHWRFVNESHDFYREPFLNILEEKAFQTFLEEDAAAWETALIQARQPLRAAGGILWRLRDLPAEALENPMLFRDAVDILRTLSARLASYGYLRLGCLAAQVKKGKTVPQDELFDRFCGQQKLILMIGQILALHSDYSIGETMKRLEEEAPVNPDFPQTLKRNVLNPYCRGYVSELFGAVYIPENNYYLSWLKGNIQSGQGEHWEETPNFSQKREELEKAFFDTPLSALQPLSPMTWEQTVTGVLVSFKQMRL